MKGEYGVKGERYEEYGSKGDKSPYRKNMSRGYGVKNEDDYGGKRYTDRR